MVFWSQCEELDGTVKSVLEPVAADIDKENIIPKDVLNQLFDVGVFDLGDSLGDLLCKVRVVARYSPAAAHTLLVHAGSWLALGRPDLGRGEILALSITEPRGGTDLRASLKTKAERGGETWYITGTKIFTSNAPYASDYIVLAVGPAGPTLYRVPRSGSVKYELLDLIGLRGTGASIVHYQKAEGQPVGTPGKGIKEALKGINLGRLGYGAIALGIIDASLRIIVEKASSTVIFGRELLTYQGIKWRIADIHMRARALEDLIETIVSRAGDTWIIDPERAAIVKVMGAEAAQKASWAAVQIMGGRGLARWSKPERLQRDARALDIGEGAREVLLDYIASQAVKAYT